jgi:pyridoxal phosphate enzyme (YggS family)
MNIEANYAVVQDRIATAARKSGRRPEEITLVAVTKTWPAEVVVTAYKAGLRDFGENRPEELEQKLPDIVDQLGNDSGGIVWHAIGSLQSRKSNLVADQADMFHALDRMKIAQRLSRRLQENGRSEISPLGVFLEVNVSGESVKAGINCSHWETDSDQREKLCNMAEAVVKLPGILPLGLMTMAPWQVDRRVIRDVFRRTRLLSEWLMEQVSVGDWRALSMGMTDDYELAIEEGATHVRVGRAIFGSRA